MKLGLVTKLDKRNAVTSKNLTMTSCRQIMTSLSFFSIYGLFGTIRKPDFECMVCKTYIFINGNLLSYKNGKQNLKISNTALILKL